MASLEINKQWQIEFIKEMTNAVQEKIIYQIEEGKIPEAWNGYELRELLAERFNRQRVSSMNRKRKRDYNNTVIINDL